MRYRTTNNHLTKHSGVGRTTFARVVTRPAARHTLTAVLAQMTGTKNILLGWTSPRTTQKAKGNVTWTKQKLYSLSYKSLFRMNYSKLWFFFFLPGLTIFAGKARLALAVIPVYPESHITVCPRSVDLFYIIMHYVKWVETSLKGCYWERKKKKKKLLWKEEKKQQ